MLLNSYRHVYMSTVYRSCISLQAKAVTMIPGFSTDICVVNVPMFCWCHCDFVLFRDQRMRTLQLRPSSSQLAQIIKSLNLYCNNLLVRFIQHTVCTPAEDRPSNDVNHCSLHEVLHATSKCSRFSEPAVLPCQACAVDFRLDKHTSPACAGLMQ